MTLSIPLSIYWTFIKKNHSKFKQLDQTVKSSCTGPNPSINTVQCVHASLLYEENVTFIWEKKTPQYCCSAWYVCFGCGYGTLNFHAVSMSQVKLMSTLQSLMGRHTSHGIQISLVIHLTRSLCCLVSFKASYVHGQKTIFHHSSILPLEGKCHKFFNCKILYIHCSVLWGQSNMFSTNYMFP